MALYGKISGRNAKVKLANYNCLTGSYAPPALPDANQ